MFCKNCGSEIKDGAKFCKSCGAKVDMTSTDDTANAVQPEESTKAADNKVKSRNGKKVAVIIGLIVVIVAIIVGVYFLIGGSESRAEVAAIETCCEGFDQADRSQQVKIFHQLHTQYAEYKNSEEPDQEILDTYVEKLQELKDSLTPLYDEKIAENTIENVSESKDEQGIKQAKSNISALWQTIQAEDIAKEDYMGKISQLIAAYDSRLSDLSKISASEAIDLVRKHHLSVMRDDYESLIKDFMSEYGMSYDDAKYWVDDDIEYSQYQYTISELEGGGGVTIVDETEKNYICETHGTNYVQWYKVNKHTKQVTDIGGGQDDYENMKKYGWLEGDIYN